VDAATLGGATGANCFAHICRLLLPSARFHSKMGNCSRTMFEGLDPIRQLQKFMCALKRIKTLRDAYPKGDPKAYLRGLARYPCSRSMSVRTLKWAVIDFTCNVERGSIRCLSQRLRGC
jgi:hypothetical protein